MEIGLYFYNVICVYLLWWENISSGVPNSQIILEEMKIDEKQRIGGEDSVSQQLMGALLAARCSLCPRSMCLHQLGKSQHCKWSSILPC